MPDLKKLSPWVVGAIAKRCETSSGLVHFSSRG
jgi:hypothetical protein